MPKVRYSSIEVKPKLSIESRILQLLNQLFVIFARIAMPCILEEPNILRTCYKGYSKDTGKEFPNKGIWIKKTKDKVSGDDGSWYKLSHDVYCDLLKVAGVTNSTTAQDPVAPSLGQLVNYVKLAKRNENTGTLTDEMLKA